MFRSLSGERLLTGGQSSPPQAGLDVTSPGLLSQESPWIGLLSLVSRPAVALLQQLLPAALRGGPECSAEAESEFFRQLGGGAGLSVDSLRELGLQSSEETDPQQPPGGHLSSSRPFLSQAGLSAQEIRPPHGWLRGRPWWGSSGTGLLSDVIWAGEGAGTGRLCPQQAETKAPSAPVFVGGWTLGENTGPTYHKEGPANNGGLLTVQNTGGSAPDLQLSTRAVCRGGAALTPDQDNGYSSLEEEHFQMCLVMYMGGAASTEPSAAVRTDMEGGASEEGASSSGQLDEEEEEEQGPSRGCQSGGVEVVSGPQCQNKAIAFIMGCPCSDDDSSQSESSDEEDDDGFDSEGSSELSDSSDDDDDDDDEDEAAGSEGDSEADHLWNSLCQSADPYNPRNFTARLHTGSSPPRAVPPSTPPASAQSSPASSPDLAPLPLSSPPSGPDTWDDSTSASEADEAESVRLWSSFSSSDPYSPFNFQAPLRTRAAPQVGPRAKARAKKASQTPSCPPHPDPASPPGYRKEEAEERLDSGFSEPGGSQRAKKVRFCDDVEEFFASCGEEEEDRRGPWEELARDRCRFLRRCQEVELSIAYCLQPQHRSLVYRRLTVLCTQDA